MTDRFTGDATLQRDGGTYSLVAGAARGGVTPDGLERIARVAREYAVPLVKQARGQRTALGIAADGLPAIAGALGLDQGRDGGPCLKYVAACPGTAPCRGGMQDALGLGAVLEARLGGRPLPSRLKVGVSGCTRNCGTCFACGPGFMATGRGRMVFFGGDGGRRPRLAAPVGANLATGEALDLAMVDHYAANARPVERTARFMERTGERAIRDRVLRLAPYLPADGGP